MASYVSVFKTFGAARYGRKSPPIALEHENDGRQIRVVLTSATTIETSGHELERGIEFTVISDSQSVGHLQNEGVAIVTGLSAMASFVTNGFTGWPRFWVGYEQGSTNNREFVQQVLKQPDGLPSPGRSVPEQGLGEFYLAVTRSKEHQRIGRAVGQYQTALSNWIPGLRILSGAHLYMAVEAIEPVARRKYLADNGLDPAGAAKAWGIDTSVYGGKSRLAAEFRRRLIFDGDKVLYEATRKASDDFEHGLQGFETVRTTFPESMHRDVAFVVRKTILDLLGLPKEIHSLLISDKYKYPIESSDIATLLRAEISGNHTFDETNPTKHPHFETSVEISDIVDNPDGTKTFRQNANYTAVLPDGVSIEPKSQEVLGPAAAAPPDSTKPQAS